MLATEPFIPAAAGNHQLPWISVGHGISKKLLALFPERGEWVTLLHLDPEGRLLGPGDYEYEPAGHVDTWTAEGDAPFVSLFFVRGAVEYLDLDGSVLRRETAATNAEEYHRACAEQGFVPLDLCR